MTDTIEQELDTKLAFYKKISDHFGTTKKPHMQKYFIYKMLKTAETEGEAVKPAVDGKLCAHCTTPLFPGLNCSFEIKDERKTKKGKTSKDRLKARIFKKKLEVHCFSCDKRYRTPMV